jgi:hypothetical protein
MNGQIQKTLCAHLCGPMKCEVEGCPNADGRPPLQKCFGRPSNGRYAARLFKENPELYQELKRQAQQAGMIFSPVVPKALQED